MRIAAYCRVSTGKEDQLDSLANQKEFFADYAARKGHQLVRLYADEGLSGTSLKKRDAFNRLMQDARSGLFQTVVVKDISRLARNTVDFLVSIRQLKAMGINTLFITANMDSMGDSEFILTLFSAMAQEESGNLSRRVKFGKKLNAQKGRVPRQLFGYDRIDNFTLSVNQEEAATVRKIFSLYTCQGLGCRSISSLLNREGDKTKLGCGWDPRGVRRILENPIYGGILVNHKYEVRDYLTGEQVLLPSREHLRHLRPQWAIVTPEVFQKAREIMTSRRTEQSPSSRYSGRHLFSTLIRCGHCGKAFVRKTYTYANTRIYWHCGTNDRQGAKGCCNTVSVEEEALLWELRQYISSRIPDADRLIEELGAAAERGLPGAVPNLPLPEKDRRRKMLLAQKDRYRELYTRDLMTLAEVTEKLSRITEKLHALEEGPEPDLPAGGPERSPGELLSGFPDPDTATNADLRRILRQICVSGDGRVEIFLKRLEADPCLLDGDSGGP